MDLTIHPYGSLSQKPARALTDEYTKHVDI